VRDAVDDITEAWQRERPTMDVEAMGITTRARRLATHLSRLRAGTLERHGLNDATLDLLATLRRAGAPYRLPVVEVRRRTLVSAGAVTMRIDRAEAKGWVVRHPYPGDARQIEVALTADGRRLVDRAAEDIATSEAALLQGLDPDERRLLDGLLRRWLAAAAA
jgi:DNA-binding MarR family transcriptional regulator